MLASLIRELIPARTSAQLSNALKSLCNTPALVSGANRGDLDAVQTARTSVLLSASQEYYSVSVKFHDHASLIIPDYFTALGYIFSMQPYGPLSMSERIRLLALYRPHFVQSRAPTTVQLLWVNSPSDTRVVLGSSLAWLKPRSHFLMARAVREGILRELWHDALVNPTPMQTRFPNPVGSLFGTCWGDCAEAISLSAFRQLVASGTSLRTLALNVAAMNAVDPLTGLSACDSILARTDLSLHDLLNILAHANAFRQMCHNCEHLRDTVGADILDCARPEFWRGVGTFAEPGGILVHG
ncbi:hypothetical protein FB45DRAFT_909483 [Roridomyces roridus]|uniref:Uncharacterized protein n=1 Tax=Roridomyces roridus TaxID=1738132 RepID=A0AAD7BYY2_9AGAR|nr:hypothetical protein FB45DRAFT_909483 [Roridomyces roridus]